MIQEVKPPAGLWRRFDKWTGSRAEAWSRAGHYRFFDYLQRWSVVAAMCSAIWASGVYISEQDARHQRLIWDAWLVVNSAHDGRGSSGRRKALEFLAKEGESLDGLVIARADMQGINLEGANLNGAIICDSNLENANFRNANLTNADLRTAKLKGAEFRGAILTRAALGGPEETTGALRLESEEAKKALGQVSARWRDSKHPCGM